MRTKLQEVKEELKLRRHLPIPEQGQWLVGLLETFDRKWGCDGE
jgi:RNA-directed DNA polymerase